MYPIYLLLPLLASGQRLSVKRFLLLVNLMGLTVGIVGLSAKVTAADVHLNQEPTPYLSDETLPPRTPPIIELGPKFLSTGNIVPGFTLPTGAVWTPSLWVYGNFRTAYQSYETSDANQNTQRSSEWVNRLDLFANLQLSGTERLLLGLTPLHDRDSGEFSGRTFNPGGERAVNSVNADIDTFFFEGDIAELFPNWDYNDSSPNDIGFTIGRQNILFMDGFLVNDSIDGIGFSKNNIRFDNNAYIINWRSSVFLGLDGVNRHTNIEDDSAKLLGWFNQVDTVHSTYNFDVVYVDSDDFSDVLNVGLDTIQRSGKLNSTYRVAGSFASDEAEEAGDGTLLFAEWSFVPSYSHDNIYLNAFVSLDDFTSAARGPLNGGPLGRTGLLFAAQSLGGFPAPLSNSSREAQGFTWGYQYFINDNRGHFIVELGARFEEEDAFENEYGLGLRFQHALGHRTLVQLDGFLTQYEGSSELLHGARIELQVKL